jgi:hypothetical protein
MKPFMGLLKMRQKNQQYYLLLLFKTFYFSFCFNLILKEGRCPFLSSSS